MRSFGRSGGGARRAGPGRARRAAHFVAGTNIDGVRTRRDRGLSGAGECVLGMLVQ